MAPVVSEFVSSPERFWLLLSSVPLKGVWPIGSDGWGLLALAGGSERVVSFVMHPCLEPRI